LSYTRTAVHGLGLSPDLLDNQSLFLDLFSFLGERWWALVSPGGVVPSLMVSVSASVNLPMKSRSSLLTPANPGGPGKRWWWFRIFFPFVVPFAGD